MSVKLGRPFGCFQLEPDQQLWLCANWDNAALTPRDLAAEVGLSKSGLYKYKVRLKLPRRPTSTPRRVSAGDNPTNRRRRGDKAEEQLARCAKIEAAERLRDTPRWKRCDLCGGREDTTAPHAHRAA